MKSSSIIAVGTLDGKSTEIAENVWKDIVVRCSREGVLCNDEEGLDFFPPGDATIEDRLQREHQSGVVWEKQRLNAEAAVNVKFSVIAVTAICFCHDGSDRKIEFREENVASKVWVRKTNKTIRCYTPFSYSAPLQHCYILFLLCILVGPESCRQKICLRASDMNL